MLSPDSISASTVLAFLASSTVTSNYITATAASTLPDTDSMASASFGTVDYSSLPTCSLDSSWKASALMPARSHA